MDEVVEGDATIVEPVEEPPIEQPPPIDKPPIEQPPIETSPIENPPIEQTATIEPAADAAAAADDAAVPPTDEEIANIPPEEPPVDKDYYEMLCDLVPDKLVFSRDRQALNAWQIYKPSEQSELFKTEEGRRIYAEAFVFQEPRSAKNVNESEQGAENASLRMTVLKSILKSYNGGPLDENIQGADLDWIGEQLTINNITIEDVVGLDVRPFCTWLDIL